MASTGLPRDSARLGPWHRVLVYFGLAEDPATPTDEHPRPLDARLAAIERGQAEQTAAIDALRDEVRRLGAR